jgi:hypothetical protein
MDYNAYWNRVRALIKAHYNIATALGVSVEFLVTGKDGKNTAIRMEQTKMRKTSAAKIKKLVGELQNEMLNI